jgi:hypothetical protein
MSAANFAPTMPILTLSITTLPIKVEPVARLPVKKMKSDIFPYLTGSTGQPKRYLLFFDSF